jgi:SPOR domain
MKATGENNVWFAIMISLTIMVGGVACFMVVKREEFFPSQYRDTHHNAEEGMEEVNQMQEGENENHIEPHVQSAVEDKKGNLNIEHVTKYALVVGSFSSVEGANTFLEGLGALCPDCQLMTTERDGIKLFRVIAGKPSSRDEIISLKRELSEKGLMDCWVFKVN